VSAYVIPPCTILKLWVKYNETGDVVNNWGGGRPQLFNAKEQTNIVRVVRKKKSITGVDITKNSKLNVHNASERSMQRLLKRMN